MRPQDWLFPCYREVGAALYRGLPLQTYIDNVFGNANDVARGRQMPDHVTGRAYHYGSVTSPIGTQITQAVGFAMAAKYRREDLVTGAYFGDGATSSNDFHAGMNFAGVYDAPTVFLLRNNGWAISVPAEQQTAALTFADKGIAYGVRAMRCDGNDPLAVYSTVRRAVEKAADGEGPTLVEMVTYRVGAHSTSDDPTAYRSESDIEEHKKGDPIERLRMYMQNLGAWSEAKEGELSEQLLAELKACIQKAEEAPRPTIATMFEDVYEDQPQHLHEQQTECENGPRARRQH
jgi:2-oxoisovalerate dehydrogenase E1 component alpha subunit